MCAAPETFLIFLGIALQAHQIGEVFLVTDIFFINPSRTTLDQFFIDIFTTSVNDTNTASITVNIGNLHTDQSILDHFCDQLLGFLAIGLTGFRCIHIGKA